MCFGVTSQSSHCVFQTVWAIYFHPDLNKQKRLPFGQPLLLQLKKDIKRDHALAARYSSYSTAESMASASSGLSILTLTIHPAS